MRKVLLAAIAFLVCAPAVPAVDFDNRVWSSPGASVFVSGLRRFARMNDGGARTGFNPYAVALGFEYATPGWSSGLAVSYETGHLRYESPGEYARIQDRTLGFTLFGTRRFGAGFYGKGSVFLGFASQRLRTGYDGTGPYAADGSDHSIRFGAGVEVGKIYEIGSGLRFTPHAGFDYASVPGSSVSYNRAGASGRVALPYQNTYEIPLGLALAKEFTVGDWTFTPSVDATLITAVGHIRERNKGARPGFASRTGAEWRVYGVGDGHWGGRITTGVKAVKAGRFDFDVNYVYERRRRHHDHRAVASVGASF